MPSASHLGHPDDPSGPERAGEAAQVVGLGGPGTAGRPGRPSELPRAPGLEDADLLAGMAARDAESLGQLYDRFGRACHALARRVLGDDNLAQDVVQEVFLTVWRDAARYQPGRGTVASYLLTITHHKAVDLVRREEGVRRRRSGPPELLDSVPSPAPGPPEHAWESVRRDRVRSAMSDLPDPQREVLALAYFGGYTQSEIATLTGVPLGTVKTRTLAGMRRLRERLAALSEEAAAHSGPGGPPTGRTGKAGA